LSISTGTRAIARTISSTIALTRRATSYADDSMPAGIDRSKFVEPQYGTSGPMASRFPAGFSGRRSDRTNSIGTSDFWRWRFHQTTTAGTCAELRRRTTFFHQFFSCFQQGYVVFGPRTTAAASAYGTRWRDACHMYVGGKDAKDAWIRRTI